MPASLAREITYNAVGPISALGFRSPTLAQLMARYATTDPTLSSITADRRQGLSLIAPPNAKRRRTIKKVLVEVKFLPFLITGLLFSDKLHLVQFQTRIQQSSASEPANAPSTSMTFITLSFKDQHWHSFLIWYFQRKQWWTILWMSQYFNKQVHPGLSHLSK
jgi:hypothetical protein